MKNIIWFAIIMSWALMPRMVWAVDSYRFLHVTIDTPWGIFLFLLPVVLSPLILMVILYWKFGFKKQGADQETERKGNEKG